MREESVCMRRFFGKEGKGISTQETFKAGCSGPLALFLSSFLRPSHLVREHQTMMKENGRPCIHACMYFSTACALFFWSVSLFCFVLFCLLFCFAFCFVLPFVLLLLPILLHDDHKKN
ncbi:MAG: hypothetical protein JOS17DRAFT_285669 [Linnemannia elongata]|nr:MAG: hypothetical protein JOS17DRAFT_285669 [Linnemannia elongata]